MTDPLATLRRRIDRLDDRILALLNERARSVQRIGAVKNQRRQDIYASTRERQILDRLGAQNSGPLPTEAVEEIFRAVINNSRLLQKKLVIAYFGPEATYTHQAAIRQFGRAASFTPLRSIADVFDEVEKQRADFGVVPIENSTEGVVNHTLDLFLESDLTVCAEREDAIHHALLSTQSQVKGLKVVYSHPQALAQCRRWLDTHLHGVTTKEAASTADAAAHAAMEAHAAAVASPLAAELYHLKILCPRIEDARDNRTRFLIIARGMTPPAPSGRDKTSLILSVRDRVGALHDLLAAFKKEGINLSKIESRPTKKRAWEYVFFVDLLGHQAEPRVRRMLAHLRRECPVVKVLGSYPRGD